MIHAPRGAIATPFASRTAAGSMERRGVMTVAVRPPEDAGEQPAVRVVGLTKSFGEVTALRDITFDVARGAILGILGPNGAGKSTLVSTLGTLITPDSGTAVIAGHDLLSDAAGVRASISMTGQYAALDETLGGRDNLIFFGRMQGLRRQSAQTRADYLLDRFGLVAAGRRPVDTYSGGMRRRLDIACGLVVKPEVVFLDEPTTGLDPRSRQAVWSLVAALRNDGITTLLTTQYLDEADQLADNIIVIDHGRIVAEGTAAELKEKVGGTYCEAVPADASGAPALRDLLVARFGTDHRCTVSDTGTVTLTAPDRVDTLGQTLDIAREDRIELLDVGPRSPSLDDVFLTLTADPHTGGSR